LLKRRYTFVAWKTSMAFIGLAYRVQLPASGFRIPAGSSKLDPGS